VAASIQRLFKHWFTGPREAARAFPLDALERLQQIITEGEQTHRAEVRLIIEAAMPLRKVWRGMSTRQRAIDLFGSYRVWDTEENNGVLLYLNLAEHQLELVTDRAAARAVTHEDWQKICDPMLAAFRQGAYEEGTAQGLRAIHRELHEVFPAQADQDGGTKDGGQCDAPVML